MQECEQMPPITKFNEGMARVLNGLRWDRERMEALLRVVGGSSCAAILFTWMLTYGSAAIDPFGLKLLPRSSTYRILKEFEKVGLIEMAGSVEISVNKKGGKKSGRRQTLWRLII